jgi:hypothetical protein
MENSEEWYGVEEIKHDPMLNDLITRLVDLKSAHVMITDHEAIAELDEGLQAAIAENLDDEIEYITDGLTSDWEKSEAEGANDRSYDPNEETVYVDE